MTYININTYSLIVLFTFIGIVIIWLASLYQIHKSIDKLTAVQIAQNDLIKELILENRINATNVSQQRTYETDKQRQI